MTPASFYLVRLLTPDHPCIASEWLGYGPQTRSEAMDAINSHFCDTSADWRKLQVIHVQFDAPSRDVTEDFEREWNDEYDAAFDWETDAADAVRYERLSA